MSEERENTKGTLHEGEDVTPNGTIIPKKMSALSGQNKKARMTPNQNGPKRRPR